MKFLRPTPSCSCVVACTCDLSKSVESYKDKEYVICFLKGLNDSFDVARSQIPLMDPLPSITKAFSLVIHQEKRGSNLVSDSLAFAAIASSQGKGPSTQGRGRGRNPNKQQMHCTTAREQITLLKPVISNTVSLLVTEPETKVPHCNSHLSILNLLQLMCSLLLLISLHL